MYIRQVSIVNYKNFKKAKFGFKGNAVNNIIGENASGKTNVFQAMRLILDDSLPANAKFLSKDDFHRGLGEPFGHWIVIAIDFEGLDETEEQQVLANYILNDGEEPKASTDGTYTFIFRPKFSFRQELYEISNDHSDFSLRKEKIINFCSSNSISRETYEPVAFVRTKLDFTDEATYKLYAGDFDQYTFPNPNLESEALIGNRKPPYFSLINEVACTYVKALRNVVADLKYYKTNPLYKLLTLKSKQISDDKSVVDDIVDVNKKISSIPEIETLSNDIARSLVNTIGSTYSPKIQVSSQLPEDFVELVQSLGLVVEDSLSYQGTGRIEDLSLGGANLIYLALKLYEYEAIRDSEEHITHFLMIEEPEAHIHTHIQKTLFENFNFKNTQVFVSTHSTQISSVSNISSMNILSRKDTITEVYSPSNQLKPENILCIERYLDAVRSDLLFAKSVILVEGDAELILIPALVKETLGISFEEMGISLIKMDGTVFKHISDLFHEDRIRSYCSILTDLDKAFITETNDTFATPEYIKSQLNAQKSGAERKEALDTYTIKNPYVEAFYAENTFETELISHIENVGLFKSVITSSYTQDAAREKVLKNIESKDKPTKYNQALKFAKKIGKGWLAAKMVGHLDVENVIPEYILRAIKFSLSDRDLQLITSKMMEYNISLMSQEIQDEINGKESFEEKVTSYKSYYNDDTFIRFMEI
ncbi:chromosome segregation protein SMC [Salinivibrio proteolyticus]|uniref:ATP-dependent nuclease n=1 Tax=Salinivibrio proteolyticus TaxID=334715 RepID=UPI000988999E|nr:AAA family ATPase [Salinivibrio proteolyticus]OOF28037.1 chromosome segregation protein SMC [Salinivibrio proteolyticus]